MLLLMRRMTLECLEAWILLIMITRIIRLKDNNEMLSVFGQYDEHLRLISDQFSVNISIKRNFVYIQGTASEAEEVYRLFKDLINRSRKGFITEKEDIRHLMGQIMENKASSLKQASETVLCVTPKGKTIVPKTARQIQYVKALNRYDIVFSIGPAGTGKTYLACAMAITALKNELVCRIILTRPVVEAGEKLGFLPGDLYEKVDPYLSPLYDAFYEMMGHDKFNRLREDGTIEIIPLAYMRGRTFNNAFIILDEAQNTTRNQMKMFLTRLGFDVKAVITGDITQVDLQNKKESGLIHVKSILQNISGIKFIYLTGKDVIRHELVKRIIKAYESHEIKSS